MAKSKLNIEVLLTEISNKVDHQYIDLDRRLDNIEKVMIAQELNLQTHMKRSDNLEKLVQTMQEKELKPLHRHVAHVEGAFKLLGVVALIVGLISGVISLFR